jgi:hypothetical protein
MTTVGGSVKDVALGPYVLQYGFAYLLASVAAKAVMQLLDLSSNPGVDIGLLVAALVVPVRRFVRDHARPFSPAEQLRFSLRAFAAALLVSVTLGLIAAILIVGSRQIPALLDQVLLQLRGHLPVIAAVLAISCLMSLAALYFASGLLARLFSKGLPAGARPRGG